MVVISTILLETEPKLFFRLQNKAGLDASQKDWAISKSHDVGPSLRFGWWCWEQLVSPLFFQGKVWRQYSLTNNQTNGLQNEKKNLKQDGLCGALLGDCEERIALTRYRFFHRWEQDRRLQTGPRLKTRVTKVRPSVCNESVYSLLENRAKLSRRPHGAPPPSECRHGAECTRPILVSNQCQPRPFFLNSLNISQWRRASSLSLYIWPRSGRRLITRTWRFPRLFRLLHVVETSRREPQPCR